MATDNTTVNIDGKTLEITMASFDEASELKNAIGDAVRESKLDISPEMLEGDVDGVSLASILNAIISVGISKRTQEAFFICAKRAQFEGKRVNKDLFEDAEMREYFYPIFFEIAKFNLTPFFKKIVSRLSLVTQTMKDYQGSKSTSEMNEF